MSSMGTHVEEHMHSNYLSIGTLVEKKIAVVQASGGLSLFFCQILERNDYVNHE